MQRNGMLLIPRLRGIGGMETVIQSWIEHYHNDPSISLFFFAPQGMENDERFSHYSNSVKVAKLLKPHFFGKIIGTAALLRELLRRRPDFVVCTSIPLLRLAELFRNILPHKFEIISWLHFSIDNLSVSDNGVLQEANMHLAISTGIKRQLVQRGVAVDKIEVVFNPANLEPVLSSLLNKDIEGPLKLLYVGRMIWDGQKNLKLLLSALEKVNFSWSLQMIGTGQDSDIESIKSYVAVHGLKEKVTLSGWSNSPFDDAEPADFLILTSKYEGFGMVLVEAATRGLPVISSDCPTGPEDIVDPNNGWLFKNDNESALIETLENAVRNRGTFSKDKVHGSVRKFGQKEYFAHLDQILGEL